MQKAGYYLRKPQEPTLEQRMRESVLRMEEVALDEADESEDEGDQSFTGDESSDETSETEEELDSEATTDEDMEMKQ